MEGEGILGCGGCMLCGAHGRSCAAGGQGNKKGTLCHDDFGKMDIHRKQGGIKESNTGFYALAKRPGRAFESQQQLEKERILSNSQGDVVIGKSRVSLVVLQNQLLTAQLISCAG